MPCIDISIRKVVHHHGLMASPSVLGRGDGPEPPPSVYLGGASWGSGFYCGVIRALQERFGPDVGRQIEVHGDSAGALLGFGFALGLPWQEMDAIYARLSAQCREEGLLGKLSIYHDDAIDTILNYAREAGVGQSTISQKGQRRQSTDEEVLATLQGRLFMGLTFFPARRVVYSRWSDLTDLRTVSAITATPPLRRCQYHYHHATAVNFVGIAATNSNLNLTLNLP